MSLQRPSAGGIRRKSRGKSRPAGVGRGDRPKSALSNRTKYFHIFVDSSYTGRWYLRLQPGRAGRIPPSSGSKKTTNATKMLPKMGLKALGHKGLKIGSIWDGYQNATSGTFRHEKRRFFMLFTRFSQEIFTCKRCDTELNWSEKPPKTSGYGRISRKMLPILKLVAKI